MSKDYRTGYGSRRPRSRGPGITDEKAHEIFSGLRESLREPPRDAAPPCEHDYQPSPVLRHTHACTLCGATIETPEALRPTAGR